jgi:hypothetical protein
MITRVGVGVEGKEGGREGARACVDVPIKHHQVCTHTHTHTHTLSSLEV